MDYLHPLVWFIALFYLGVISIEIILIARDKDHTIIDAVVRTSQNIVKKITVKTHHQI
jgi:hypothetical protein